MYVKKTDYNANLNEINSMIDFLVTSGISTINWNYKSKKIRVKGWLKSLKKFKELIDSDVLSQDSFLDAIHIEDVVSVKDLINKLIEKDIEKFDITIRLKLNDTKDKWSWVRILAKISDVEDVISGMVLDTTQQRKSLYDFSLNLSLLTSALELSNISGIYIPINNDDEEVYVHFFASLFHSFDIKPEELKYKNRHYSISNFTFKNLIHSEDKYVLEELLDSAQSAPGQIFEDKIRFRISENTYQWFRLILSKKHTPYGDGIVAAIANSNEDVKHLKNIEFEATHDKLTLLKNRVALNNFKYKKNMNLAVIFLDLDDFKEVNDLFGHDAGDIVLKTISDRLCDIFSSEEVYRLGGDEFLILVEDYNNETLDVKLNEIIKKINMPVINKEEKYKVGVSVGVTKKLSKRNDATFKDLLNEADFAMYECKQHGKNTIKVIKDSDIPKYKERALLESKFRDAFDEDQIFPVYLPIKNIETNEIVGLEALARWKYDGKIIPADEFLNITQKYNLLYQLDLTIFNKALKDLKNLRDSNLVSLDTFKLYINLSSNTIKTIDAKSLIPILANYDLKPENIAFEINEAYTSDQSIDSTTDELKKLGFCIILDDYDSNHTAIDFLVKSNFNHVKIDQNILPDFKSTDVVNKKLQLVYSHLVKLMQALNLHVIAEGVETEDQYNALKKENIKFAQGYFISKPLEFVDIIKFITNKKS